MQLCLAAAALIVVAAAAPVARWWVSRFAVTTRRLIMRSGPWRRQRHELALPEVAEINVDRPLIGRVLGYGTVRVVDRNGGQEMFPRVAEPEGLREALLRHPHGTRRKGTG
jgi:hypothetical protein